MNKLANNVFEELYLLKIENKPLQTCNSSQYLAEAQNFRWTSFIINNKKNLLLTIRGKDGGFLMRGEHERPVQGFVSLSEKRPEVSYSQELGEEFFFKLPEHQSDWF